MKIPKELRQFQAVEDKLSKLLADNNLVHSFATKGYPITLTISQDKDPSAQMEIYSQDDGDVSAWDSRLVFAFQDGEIVVRTDSRLVISDALMGKIKGYAKKMHYLYLQAFYRGIVDQRELEEADEAPESDEDVRADSFEDDEENVDEYGYEDEN